MRSIASAPLAVRCLVALGLALAVAAPSLARAAGDKGEKGDKADCASASEEAQRLQKQGKLVDAQKQLLICTRSVCPAVVRQDCEAWLPTLGAMIPSLVVAARDDEGRDLVDVSVSLDGAPVDSASGRAVQLDPGKHLLHVESPGRVPVDQAVVVHEGERARPVTVTLSSKDKPVKPPVVAPPPPQVVVVQAPPAPQTSPLVWILGTLATVSLASFVAFEVKASTDASHLRSTCAPRCPQSDVDSVSTLSVVGNLSLAASGLFVGGALAAWLLGRTQGAAAPRAGLVLGPGAIGLRGEL